MIKLSPMRCFTAEKQPARKGRANAIVISLLEGIYYIISEPRVCWSNCLLQGHRLQLHRTKIKRTIVYLYCLSVEGNVEKFGNDAVVDGIGYGMFTWQFEFCA